MSEAKITKDGQRLPIVPIRAKSPGKSMFVSWEDLNEFINKWAEGTFDRTAHGSALREQSRFYINVYSIAGSIGLPIAKQIFARYDPEGEYDAEEEFHGGKSGVFPEKVTLGIIADQVSDVWGFRPKRLLATLGGAFFFENDVLAPEDS